ncbi:MAG: CDP-alcohol phosphatidyltransferase family protein [Patescibacteria group bacterium]|jgi:CDP-diacylglycerol--glycerol-3-phosphate 3-phosphatidyltransferase
MAKLFDRAITPVLNRIPRWVHPNLITIARGILVVPVILFAREGYPWLAITALLVSSACDIMDGPLARHRGIANGAGVWLDPMSDKVFVLGALFFACSGRIPYVVCTVILALEAALVLIRLFKTSEDTTSASAKSNAFGAIKTWAQSFAIGFVLSGNFILYQLSAYAIGLALALAGASFFRHLRDIISPRER